MELKLLFFAFAFIGTISSVAAKISNEETPSANDHQQLLTDKSALVSVLVPETPAIQSPPSAIHQLPPAVETPILEDGEIPPTDSAHQLPPAKPRRTPRPPRNTRPPRPERSTRLPRPTRRPHPPQRTHSNPNRTRITTTNSSLNQTGSSGASTTTSHSLNGPAVFSSYLFTLQWPPTLKKDSPRGFSEAGHPNIEEWTIAGLQPEEVTGGRCRSDHRFEVAALSASLSGLTARWPSFVRSRPAEALWRHQWSRHGVCFNLSVPEFFAKAVELSEQLPVQKWLEAGDVLPTSDQLYRLEDFERALSGRVAPGQFILSCKDVRVDGKRVALLKELSVCVARDGLSLADCKKKSQPSAVNACKGDGFFYLPATATVSAVGSSGSGEHGGKRRTPAGAAAEANLI